MINNFITGKFTLHIIQTNPNFTICWADKKDSEESQELSWDDSIYMLEVWA